jgi:hypothetical protein
MPSPPSAAVTRSNELSAAITADVRAREMAMPKRLAALAKADDLPDRLGA